MGGGVEEMTLSIEKGEILFPLGRLKRDLEWFVAILLKLVTIHGLNGADGVVVVVVSHKSETFARTRRQVALDMDFRDSAERSKETVQLNFRSVRADVVYEKRMTSIRRFHLNGRELSSG